MNAVHNINTPMKGHSQTSKHTSISNDSFHTPLRPTSNSAIPAAPQSAYVDYTPRHLHPPSTPAHRSQVQSYMDSPIVRRQLGVNADVRHISPEPAVEQQEREDTMLKSRKEDWCVDDFDVGQHIGTGKFGRAYIAQEKTSKHVVALKILQKDEIQTAQVFPFLKREIEIQGHLRHPNILRLYGYFHDDEHVYMVLEYAPNGDLYQLLREKKRLSERQTALYMVQVTDAMMYLHTLNVTHRDLKPENVLIGQDGRLKLADFGWAIHDPKPRRRTFCGTLDYLPPEMVESQPHDQRVDVWSLGILCYELLTGAPPFEDLNEGYTATYEKILNVDYTFPPHVSDLARKFVQKLLKRNPQDRLAVSEIQHDPWICKYMASQTARQR
ncbi:kinase-like domain-containing protein [Umbelopsis sp. PMI_123]|nr:kinase-like domain-containing protein [Umbelopsis sp. PMI_123]